MVSAENGICINDCSLRILTQIICYWSWDLSALRQTEASSMTKTFGQSPDDAHPICSTWAAQIHRQMSPLLLSGHPGLTNQHFGLPEVTSKRAGQAHSNLFLSTCNTHFMYVYMELRHYYYFCLFVYKWSHLTADYFYIINAAAQLNNWNFTNNQAWITILSMPLGPREVLIASATAETMRKKNAMYWAYQKENWQWLCMGTLTAKVQLYPPVLLHDTSTHADTGIVAV